MNVLCGAITKSACQPNENTNQYVDLTNNNKPTCALLDTKATHKFVIKVATKRLELKLVPTNSRVKTMNVEAQNAQSVANGVSDKLDNWKGTKNFTATTMDIFDIVLRHEFFIQYHTSMDPFLQHLMVLELEGSCMVPTMTMPHKHCQAQI